MTQLFSDINQFVSGMWSIQATTELEFTATLNQKCPSECKIYHTYNHTFVNSSDIHDSSHKLFVLRGAIGALRDKGPL